MSECAISRCTFLYLQSIYLYICAQVRVWSCLVIDNFSLFTEIAVCQFLRGFAVVWPETFLFCPLYVFIHFSPSFCMAHCALDLARDNAP